MEMHISQSSMKRRGFNFFSVFYVSTSLHVSMKYVLVSVSPPKNLSIDIELVVKLKLLTGEYTIIIKTILG